MPIFGEYQTVGEPVSVVDERGHISTVWQARQTGDNRLFAIKCYAPRTREAKAAQTDDLDKDRGIEFLEAIKQLKKAQSEGGRCLSPVHAMGIAPEGAWYATDFYPGRSLRAWITNRGNVDTEGLKQVVYCCVVGCLALKRSRGYSHGNLKSTNVFLVGSPKPLRKRPLHLGDPYPASASHLANLDAEDRAAVTELLAQTAEVQDLRAIGELILQLVEGRVVANAYDYNYPIDRSRHWDNLGKDGETWRALCNQLLDPHLAPETISLEELQKRFAPNPMAERLPLILGVAAGVAVVSALGFFAVSKWKAASQAEKQEAARHANDEFQVAIKSGQMALDSGDYEGAANRATEALKLKPREPAALKLQSDAQAKLAGFNKQARDAIYARAMADATNALALADQALLSTNYDAASSQLETASTSCTMARTNGDVAAVDQLTSQIERRKTDLRNARDSGARAIRYAAALAEATNSMRFAESASDGKSALNAIDAALKNCEVARTNGDSVFVDSFITILTARRGDITRNMSRGEQYGNALTEATNAFDRAEQALGKMDYQAASREFETAYTKCSIALTNANGSQALAVKQYQQKIEDRRKTAGELMARADHYLTALKDATNAWSRAQTAIRNTNYETALLEISTALDKCEIARTNGDVAAVNQFSKDLTARKQEIGGKIDLSRQYTKALRDATNAMNLADRELKQGDYNSAFTNISLALDHSSSARSKGDARPVSQLEDELRKRRSNIEGTIRFQSAMANATNSLQQADAAEKKADWDGALKHIQQASTYADAAGANKQTSELAQLRGLLETKKISINVRKDKIDRYAKAMNQATNALSAADQAYKGTNYDGALKSIEDGLQYCDSARLNADNVAAVNDLRSVMAGRQKTIQLAIDTRDAGARRYRAAMDSATNNWKQAVAAGTNYDSALGLVQNALKDCAAAATNQTTADTPRLVSELTKLQSELAQRREVMQRETALAAARSSFSNGDYDKAQALCADHKGVGDFDSLAKDIAAEQAALNRARQDFAAGKYAFLKELESQSYSKKQPFADLAVNARKEDTLLSTLTNLKQATNWSAVLTQVQGASPDTLKKAPFAEVNQWAQGENAKILGQKEARKKALDSQLAALMVTLNAAPPSWLKQLAPAAAKRYESDTMPDATRDYYTKQADDLEKKYKNEGLLDSDKRKDYLKTVRERINNWG
jgi:hypothetical protein